MFNRSGFNRQPYNRLSIIRVVLSGALNFSGTILYALNGVFLKLLSGTLNLAGSLSTTKRIKAALSGTLNLAGAVGRKIKLTLAGAVSLAGSLTILHKLIGAWNVTLDSALPINTFSLSPFIVDYTGTVTQIRIRAVTACHVKVAIYSDNVGEPDRLLSAVDTSTALVAGWNKISIPMLSVGAGTTFWLGLNSGE
jgi:hypothetical protein